MLRSGTTLLTGVESPTIRVGKGADRVVLKGEEGEDVHGGSGNDVLITGDGWDSVHGDGGSDELRAGGGRDFVFAETGDVGSEETKPNRLVDCGAGSPDYVTIDRNDVDPRHCEIQNSSPN